MLYNCILTYFYRVVKEKFMEDDGDIFALIKEECELNDEWLREREEN